MSTMITETEALSITGIRRRLPTAVTGRQIFLFHEVESTNSTSARSTAGRSATGTAGAGAAGVA